MDKNMGGKIQPDFSYEDYRKILAIILLTDSVDRKEVDKISIKLLDYFEALREINT